MFEGRVKRVRVRLKGGRVRVFLTWMCEVRVKGGRVRVFLTWMCEGDSGVIPGSPILLAGEGVAIASEDGYKKTEDTGRQD